MIAFTKVRLPFGWMGNMSPHAIVDDDVYYPTAEHHFQLARLPKDHKARAGVLSNNNPMAAKLAVKMFPEDFIVEPLSEADLDNMRMTLRLKFSQHPALAALLIATYPEILVEDVSARQSKGSAMFWGGVPLDDHAYRGTNMLGKLLMSLRSDLVVKEQPE